MRPDEPLERTPPVIATAAQFQAEYQVSAAVIDRLNRYQALLSDWQTRLNLVGPNTLPEIWSRHFADSAQLSRLVPAGQRWVDIGAGAGFPGLVLAAMDWGQVTLIESIQKKAKFLEAACEALGLQQVTILNHRAEALAPLGAEVATARAVAPLEKLIPWAKRHLGVGGTMLFPKGRNWATELAAARRFGLAFDAIPSETDAEARILRCRIPEGSRCES